MESYLPDEKLARVQQAVTARLAGQECDETRNLVTGGAATTCSQSGLSRTDVCETHVQSSTQSTRTRFLYQAKSGIPVRPILVAYLSARLEWCQPSSTSSSCTTSMILQTDASGTWGCGAFLCPQLVVSVAMARCMVISSNYDQAGTSSYCASVWGPRLARKTVLVQCDNTGVVAAVQKGTSND